MTDILQLPGWEVTGIRLDGEYIIEAVYTAQADSCVKCGVIGNLEAHHVIPMVEGEWTRHVYTCASCHRRFHTQETSHGNQLSTPDYE